MDLQAICMMIVQRREKRRGPLRKEATVIHGNGMMGSWIVVVIKASNEFNKGYSKIFIRAW